MQTKHEALEGHNVKLTVTVPAAEVDEAFVAAYKRVAEEMKIPGFRKGHVPPKVIDNYVGKVHVQAEAQEQLVNEAYPRALDAERLRPVGQPDMGELALPVEGEEFTFEAELEIRPELELMSHTGIRVTATPSEASDTEIDQQIESMRDRFATLEVEEGGAVSENGFALLSFSGSIEGEKFEGSDIEQFLYEFGKGQMPDEWEQGLVGAVADEKREVSFTIPETTSRPEFSGKLATFEVEIHEVKKKTLPELDDDFAQSAGFDTVEKMRENVREQITKAKQSGRARMIEDDARRQLAANLVGEIPESMIERRSGDIIRDFFNSLESQGIEPEAYTRSRNITLEDLEEEFQEEAVSSIRVELALEALFRKLEFEVTDEDLDKELAEYVGDDRSLDEVRDRFVRSGMMVMLREQAMQRKASLWLLDNIEIIESDPEENAADSEEG